MDLVAHLYRQRAFSRATFGPGDRTLGVTDHISKELEEIKAAHKTYNDTKHFYEIRSSTYSHHLNNLRNEWVDVIILGFDGLWRTGATPEEIVDLIKKKQEKNENRNWPDWRTADPNAAIEHVKE